MKIVLSWNASLQVSKEISKKFQKILPPILVCNRQPEETLGFGKFCGKDENYRRRRRPFSKFGVICEKSLLIIHEFFSNVPFCLRQVMVFLKPNIEKFPKNTQHSIFHQTFGLTRQLFVVIIPSCINPIRTWGVDHLKCWMGD